MDEIVVVGHQPQYMPYVGILSKISLCDIYIIVDHVQFVRKYFHNRTYIKVGEESRLLTIPVLSKGKFESAICEIEINHNTNWIRKHLKTIRLAYSKAPFFERYYELIEDIFLKRHAHLSIFTSELLIFFLKEFELVEDIRFSSSMGILGNKTDLLMDLTRAVNGNVYISGEGARDYFDEELFDRSGFRHRFAHFEHPQYLQLGRNFLEGMGCIDLLFNCGKDGRKYIISRERQLV